VVLKQAKLSISPGRKLRKWFRFEDKSLFLQIGGRGMKENGGGWKSPCLLPCDIFVRWVFELRPERLSNAIK